MNIPEQFKQFRGEDVIESIKDHEREQVNWLLYPFIPLGCITLLQGDPGCGKSIFMMNVAAALSKGRCLHGDWDISGPSAIIYQSREDSYNSVIRPRLEDLGADLNITYDIKDNEADLKATDLRIPYTIWLKKAKLVVLDTLPKYLNSPEDLYHQGQLLPQLKVLDQAAREYNCAVVLIIHMNKNEGSKTVYRGLGSISLAGYARSSIMLEKEEKGIRKLSIVKSNLGPDDIEDKYQLDRSGVYHFISRSKETQYWDSDEDITLSPAGQMLKELLSKGPKTSKEVKSIMFASGFSERKFGNAKTELGVKPYRTGNAWMMKLKEE